MLKRFIYCIKYFRYLITNFKLCFQCYKVILGGYLCNKCWNKLEFLEHNRCGICGLKSKTNCVNCNLYVRSLLLYKNIDLLILQLKYNKKYYLCEFFIRLMVNIYIKKENFLILYVPHFYGKQITTSINSSLLLAYEFKKQFGGVIIHNILKKINKKRQKDAKNYKDRMNNSFENYVINNELALQLKDRDVILIDDIVTTGSTITTCGGLIQKYSPKSLQILTIGKV